MKKLKSLFWRTYHRLTLGDTYDTVLANARLFGGYLNEQADGNYAKRQYNALGEQIRGYHKPLYKSANVEHHLIQKYK